MFSFVPRHWRPTRATSLAFACSAWRNCGANGGGSITVKRQGSVATCSSSPLATGFRNSRTAGSARRPGESCKRWRRPGGQRGGFVRRRVQPETRRASGSGMARPDSHRHYHGRWVRVCRVELSVPDQDRQKDHRSALVGAALLWSASGRRGASGPWGAR